jgi:hypothetical protein
LRVYRVHFVEDDDVAHLRKALQFPEASLTESQTWFTPARLNGIAGDDPGGVSQPLRSRHRLLGPPWMWRGKADPGFKD